MFSFCKYGSSLFPGDLFQAHWIPKSMGAQAPYQEICVWLNLQMQNPGYGGPNIPPNCSLEWLYQLTLPPASVLWEYLFLNKLGQALLEECTQYAYENMFTLVVYSYNGESNVTINFSVPERVTGIGIDKTEIIF